MYELVKGGVLPGENGKDREMTDKETLRMLTTLDNIDKLTGIPYVMIMEEDNGTE